MDLDTQEILAVKLTGNDEADAPVAKKILEGRANTIESFSGDGAYDDADFQSDCFRAFLGNEVKQIIPPPKNAAARPEIENGPEMACLKQRNDAVNTINETNRDEWKEKSGYHKRSLNEVVMYRYKTIIGEKLSARKSKNQEKEAQLNGKPLNVYCELGMPVSYKVD
jgi:hypothetical protein